MPELPEVQTVINGLVNAVSGSKIISVECNYPGTVIIHSDVDKDALPARIKSFERRGKYILIHLENEHSLVVHLRMTGKLVFQSESNKEIHKHQRACFLLDHDQKLVFIDPRTFGKIILCRTDTLKNPSLSSVAKLGPEPLEQTFDFEYLKHKLSGRSLPIKNLL
ncbi:MAG: DNA-formamidopyrimidine glycosylase family protein, partial [Candidatus Cloacimonadaceae bacterium]|nr:DNA-formamidopyrimidine glycosylase family protein [Candidatus Cloacimonadaceae bacterium]